MFVGHVATSSVASTAMHVAMLSLNVARVAPARVSVRGAKSVARHPSTFARRRVTVAGLKDLDKDLAKVNPSEMRDALDGDDREVRQQAVIGIAGCAACGVMGWSLVTLRNTVWPSPGPLGLVGAAEGVSYLYVVGLIAWSAVKKAKTGSGLPEGPGGVLGLAEGLAYLCALGDSSYSPGRSPTSDSSPNAVPVEGGRCFS